MRRSAIIVSAVVAGFANGKLTREHFLAIEDDPDKAAAEYERYEAGVRSQSSQF